MNTILKGIFILACLSTSFSLFAAVEEVNNPEVYVCKKEDQSISYSLYRSGFEDRLCELHDSYSENFWFAKFEPDFCENKLAQLLEAHRGEGFKCPVPEVYVCTKENQSISYSLYRSGFKGRLCELHNSYSGTFWYAKFEPDFCENKLAKFLEAHRNDGFKCPVLEEE